MCTLAEAAYNAFNVLRLIQLNGHSKNAMRKISKKMPCLHLLLSF